jgi:hypothetical protein
VSQALEQSFANWAQVAAAAILLVGAVIVPVVIFRASRRVARQEAVFRYLERHDRDSFSQLLTWANGIAVLRDGESPEDAAARYGKLSDYQQDQLWRVLNFWEETSQVYVNGLFDEGVFRGTLGPWLVESWLDNHWLINHLRQADDGGVDLSLWNTWETVCRRLLKAGVRYTHRPDSGAPTHATAAGSAREDWSSLPPDSVNSPRGASPAP